jgi:hypothetical protein
MIGCIFGLFLYNLLRVMELMESVLQISFTIVLFCESYAPYFSRARGCNQCDGLTSFVIVCLLYLKIQLIKIFE